MPFTPLTPRAAAAKVKTLLTGLALTPNELVDLQDSNNLSTYVDAWMAAPQYGAKMEQFFADAFQQSQDSATFFDNVYDGSNSPNDALLHNYETSFAKTVTAINAAGQPFTQVATTQTFMVTTAMLVDMAFHDTVCTDDNGNGFNYFLQNNGNWNYTLENTSQVSLADSANPASSNYLTFYDASLGGGYSNQDNPDTNLTLCNSVTSINMNQGTSFARAGNLTYWLYQFLQGYGIWFFTDANHGEATNEQDLSGSIWCRQNTAAAGPILQTSDYSDWRMVTFSQPTAESDHTKFYDIAGLRAATAVRLRTPYVGFFTTPSFLSQWSTNSSNQARVTMNQTLIVGLGHAFDGNNTVPLTGAPGQDPNHTIQPACAACHDNLDPMRQFFRNSYSLRFNPQTNPNEINTKPTFAFDGVTRPLNTIYDLGAQIAAHPSFALAWATKVCTWANGVSCSSTDPELVRVANVFASNNYQWTTLVREMMLSPLVTNLAETATAASAGVTIAMARRAQFCDQLASRLNLTDPCGLASTPPSGVATSIPSLAGMLPSDAYSRGQVAPVYVNTPSPFFRNTVENICALVADRVVDAGATPLYSSSDVPTSIAAMVHGLMGVPPPQDSTPIGILTDTFNESVTAGADSTHALKSVFVVACESPYLVSIGQ